MNDKSYYAIMSDRGLQYEYWQAVSELLVQEMYHAA